MGRRRVALLRGINVGGHRKVPMAELRALLSDLPDLSDVQTYIQSGNIVFSGGDPERAMVEALIATALESHFGFAVPVIVRDADVLPAVLAHSAILYPTPATGPEVATHDKFTHVGFLTRSPDDLAVQQIDLDRSPGDSIAVRGEHAYVSYAQGASTTKLTGEYIERTLGVGMTMRNLATVRKLAELV